MELGKKIRQLRFKAGLTQEQLAEKLGIGAQSVSKWENAATMPDISALPLLAEIFGVSIDDLFDLTAEQRLNRIENRMDIEKELPADVFREYEDYLKTQLSSEEYADRAGELLAYLYWHRMNASGEKVRKYARESIRRHPEKKVCQWMLAQAEQHFVWDWNISNHNRAIEFYRELTEAHPDVRLPYFYLLDNLIADHRTKEAEQALAKFAALPDTNPVMAEVYRAHIALARFDEPEADRIMAEAEKRWPEDDALLFETAQYFARKCDYPKAIEYYEKSFEADKRRPRFIDALQGIADCCEIMGEYGKAGEAWSRIVRLQKEEWGMTEETELKDAEKERDRLLAKA